MLFKNILSISLLALQAGFSVAKPISGHERREAAIAEQGAKLLPREDKFTESGTITGTAADTLRTYGLATCPGLAASGSAEPQGDGTNKVLAHIQCSPDGATPQQMLDDWVAAVRASGMTNIKIVVDVLNPNLVPGPLMAAQTAVNSAAQAAAQSIGGYGTTFRQSVADPLPSGTLMILADGTITVGGQVVM